MINNSGYHFLPSGGQSHVRTWSNFNLWLEQGKSKIAIWSVRMRILERFLKMDKRSL